MRLYEITNQYQMLLNKIEDSEIVTDELKQEIASIELSGTEKIKNEAYVIRMLTKDIDIINDEIERLKHKKQTLEDSIDYLKNDICMGMQKLNLTQVKAKPHFNINLREGKWKVDELTLDQDMIPDEYKRTKINISINKIKLAEEILAGVVVPGARLVKEPYIEIR